MEKNINGEFLWENAFNKILRGKFLIKDEKYLNVNFCSKILHREDELNELLILFGNLVIHDFSKGINQFVIGKPGVGKTATVTYFCERLVECAENRGVNLKYIHVNCRKEGSWYRVLIKIIKKFFSNFPERGYSPQELLDNLVDYLINQKKHLLIILDDLDYLLKKDSKFLYSITRLNENFRNSHDLISLIAVLKDISLIKDIVKDILPFFQKNIIKFKRYKREQIFDILKERAIHGLKTGCFSDDLLNKITYMVREVGDLRYGINLLWKSAKIAMSKVLDCISLECVELANKGLSYYPSYDRLKYLTIPQLSFLLSIVKEIRSSENDEVSINETLNTYDSFCAKLNIKPKSYSQLWNFLQNFKKDELIYSEIKSESIRGRKTILKCQDIDLIKLEKNIINSLISRGYHI